MILDHECIPVESPENVERTRKANSGASRFNRDQNAEQINNSTHSAETGHQPGDHERNHSRGILPAGIAHKRSSISKKSDELDINSARNRNMGSDGSENQCGNSQALENGQYNNTATKVSSFLSSSKPQTKNMPKPARKRGRYVSTGACLNCKKRKVRCSGEESCMTCSSAGLICAYDQGRKRPSSANVLHSTIAGIPSLSSTERSTEEVIIVHSLKEVPFSTADSSSESTQSADVLLQILARLTSLEEQDHKILEAFTGLSNDRRKSKGSPDSDRHIENSTGSQSEFDGAPTNSMKVFYGSTSLNEPIEALKRTVGHDGEEQPDIEIEHSLLSMNHSPMSNTETGSKASRLGTILTDTLALRSAVDVFFSVLNPQYPCINEHNFRAQLEKYISSEPNQIKNTIPTQFVALVNLIEAEVKALYENSSDPNQIPGWEEFCRAERILNQVGWLGGGDILTIQCLSIKTRYLLYIKKPMGAYHCIGQAVRLCFQLGLHNQASWDNCNPFEIVMRQRIFWTIFYLERHSCFNLGMPNAIRECEIAVDVPKEFDERFLISSEALPAEHQIQSYVPFMKCAIRWARMCAELWDKFFRVNTPKPLNQELMASMDGIILYTVSQFPSHLRYSSEFGRTEINGDLPPFIMRQALALHLRTDQLRLLLRQESILSLQFNEQTALECTSIAASTINAVHEHFSPDYSSPIDRYCATTFVVGAFLTLICIIIKTDDCQPPTELAVVSFERGLSLLEVIATKFHLARYFLDRLTRVITTAQQSIHRYQSPEKYTHDPQEFEMETLVPQMLTFLNEDPWNLDLGIDALDQQFDISQGLGTFSDQKLHGSRESGALFGHVF